MPRTTKSGIAASTADRPATLGESGKLRKPAVIFDLGNVVFDWNVDGILHSLGLEPPLRAQLERELFAHGDWLELDRGCKTEAEVAAEICARSSLEPALVERCFSAARDSLSPLDATIALLDELAAAGHRLYCLSNMSRETWAHVRGQAFFDLFDGIVISALEGCVKPEAEIFARLLERYAVLPADAFFIDDLAANVAAARRLGIDGYRFRRTPQCYAEIRRAVG